MMGVMQRLDLRKVRCPLALVLLKQQLLTLALNDAINVLFSNQEAMQDIKLYLNKKNYDYSCNENSLLVKYKNN